MSQRRITVPILGSSAERQVLKINAETLKNMFAIPTGETGSDQTALEQAHVLTPQTNTITSIGYETLFLHTKDAQLTTSAADYTEQYDTGQLGANGDGTVAVGHDPDEFADVATMFEDGTNLWMFKNIRYTGNDAGTARQVDAPAILKFVTDTDGLLQSSTTVGNRIYLRNDISPITADEFVKLVKLGDDMFGIIYDTSAETGTYFTFDSTLGHNQTAAVIDTSISNFLGAKDILVWDGYVVALDDTANTLFHSDLNDATTWNALNTLTTTWTDKQLERIALLNNNMWVFADDKIRVYYNAGNPIGQFFTERQGVAFNFGIGPRRTLAEDSSSLIWMDNERRIVQATSISQIRELTTPTIREKIGNLATINDAQAHVYEYAGRKFYHITFPTENLSLVCDLRSGLWHSRSTTVNSSEVEHALVGSINHKNTWYSVGTEQSDDDDSYTIGTVSLPYTGTEIQSTMLTSGVGIPIIAAGSLEVLASGELILNTITLDGVPASDSNSTTDDTASADALATAINASTGVSGKFSAAAGVTTCYLGVYERADADLAGTELQINNTNITGDASTAALLVALINAAGITPAITAAVETIAGVGDTIKLTQASGYNIELYTSGDSNLLLSHLSEPGTPPKHNNAWGTKMLTPGAANLVVRAPITITAGTETTLSVGGTKAAELGFELSDVSATISNNPSSDSIYRWSKSGTSEYSTGQIVERTSQHILAEGNMVYIDRLMLDIEVTSSVSTDTVTLEYSKDGGNSWSTAVSRTLPLTSQNGKFVVWNRLGRGRRWTFRLKSSGSSRYAILNGWADVRVTGVNE